MTEKLKKYLKTNTGQMTIFCILFVISVLLMLITVNSDRAKNTPTDNDPRAEAEVVSVTEFSSGSTDGFYECDVQISFEVDGKRIDGVYLYGIPKVEAGQKIIVKYKYGNPYDCLYADDKPAQYSVGLYVLFACISVFSLGGIFLSFRKMDIISHKKHLLDSLEDGSKYDEHPEDDLNSIDAYMGFDGKGPSVDSVNPFDNSIDYNSVYEYDNNMNDAYYSADTTYSGYDPSQPGDNTAGYDPNAFYGSSEPYGGYDSQDGQYNEPVYENEVPKKKSFDFDPNDLSSLIRSDSETYNGAGGSDAPYYPNAVTYPNADTAQDINREGSPNG